MQMSTLNQVLADDNQEPNEEKRLKLNNRFGILSKYDQELMFLINSKVFEGISLDREDTDTLTHLIHKYGR